MVVIGRRFVFHYKLEPDKQRARDHFSAWEKINAVSQKCFSVYLIAVIVIQWHRFFLHYFLRWICQSAALAAWLGETFCISFSLP